MRKHLLLSMSVLTILGVALLPGDAEAQACIGVPARDGQLAVAGRVGFAEEQEDPSYGADISANLTGQLSTQFGYTRLQSPDANQFSGRLAWELALVEPSVCPNIGVGFTRWTGDASSIIVPVGLGLGKTVEAAPALSLTLFAVPQYLWVRNEVDPGASLDGDVRTSSEFGIDLGLLFSTPAFFAGGGMNATSIRNSDPEFRVTAGIIF